MFYCYFCWVRQATWITLTFALMFILGCASPEDKKIQKIQRLISEFSRDYDVPTSISERYVSHNVVTPWKPVMKNPAEEAEKTLQQDYRWWATPELIKALKSENPNIRYHSAMTLGRIGYLAADAVEPLCALLSDDEPRVRNGAVIALGWIGEPAAVESLIGCLNDNNAMVRRNAAQTLGELGDNHAVEPLIRVLQKEARIPHTGFFVSTVIQALGNFRDPRAVHPLANLLIEDAQLQIWEPSGIMRALGKIGDTSAVGPILQAWKMHRDDISFPFHEASMTLSEITGQEHGYNQPQENEWTVDEWEQWWNNQN